MSLSELGHTPHYVPMEDPLVQTLLSVYENKQVFKVMNKNHRWWNLWSFIGTWCSLDYVPRLYRYYAPANEFIALDDLFRAAIYAEAI